jgi:hypothetical protein
MRDNILKDVYENDKIELSSIEVNLAFEFKKFEEVDKKIDSIYNPFLEALNKIYPLQKLANDLGKKSSTELFNLSSDLEAQKQLFIKKVNDLGIDISKLSQPNDYQKRINRAVELSNYVKKELSKINI